MSTALAQNYMNDVLSGRIVACEPVKQAVRRQEFDINTGEDRGLYFDEDAAERAINFFGFLKHTKGKWAGKPVLLEPWQCFIVYTIFGWKWKATGSRRFQTAYVEVSRKNGKTTFAAGIALYALLADGEAGAEVYTGATTRDQAKICFQEAKNMVDKSMSLKRKATALTHNISVLSTASKMEPVSSDYNTLDGLNPHCVILDELHAYKTSGLYDIFTSAIGAREQPLIFMITTAGFNKEWWCFEFRKSVLEMLNGAIEDDTLFGIVYTLDEEDQDDWQNPELFIKANPNLGVSVSLQYLQNKVHQAQIRPSEQFNVKTKNLNMWVDAPKVWIPQDTWEKGNVPVDEEDFAGQLCYAGLDLATKEDFNAFVIAFPDDDGGFDIVCRFWIPKETVDKRRKEGLTAIDQWIDEGWIRVTEGNYVDYRKILEDILEDFKRFDLQSIAKDAWNSGWMYQELNSLLDPVYRNGKSQPRVTDFNQSIKSMTSPTVHLENLCDEGKLRHGGNPVLAWMMRNVALEFLGKEVEDPISGKPQQARKPSKIKSAKKIDGAVSLVMAIGEYLTWNWSAEPQTEYKRGDMYA